jgi:hypothetical protein
MDLETVLSAYLTWDLDTVMASFETPGSWPQPASNGGRTWPGTSTPCRPAIADARRLRDVTAPIGEHALWSPKTNAVLAKLGLAFGPGYLWGRAVGLGDPSSELVASAFAVYKPEVVIAVYEHARRQCGRAGFQAARDDATIASLHEILGDVDVTRAAAVLRRGVEAADSCGRILYSGVRSLAWPDDPMGQLWRACEALREHRGDSHQAVWVAAGLGPVAINLLTELWLGMSLGLYTSLRRGWSEDDIAAALADLETRGLVASGELTPAGRKLRDVIEEQTDALEQPIIDAIGDDLDTTLRTIDAWSAAVADSGAFPRGTYQPA